MVCGVTKTVGSKVMMAVRRVRVRALHGTERGYQAPIREVLSRSMSSATTRSSNLSDVRSDILHSPCAAPPR